MAERELTDDEAAALGLHERELTDNEAEALGLGAPSWATARPDAAPAVTLGATSTGAAHAARHLAFGLGDKLMAAMESLNDLRHDKTGQSFGDIYDRNLAFNDQLLEDSDKAHPTARWVGNGIGIGGNLAALAGVAPIRAALAARGLVSAAPRVLAAPTIIGRALQGAAEGAGTGTTLGAVGGYASSRGDHPLLNTALGAGYGLVTGGALGGVGGGISGAYANRVSPTAEKLARDKIRDALADVASEQGQSFPMVARGVAPDPEAQVLQKYGVRLTLGQMQPNGAASEAEEAALRIPLLGKTIAAQRAAAEQDWRNAVVNQTRGPIEGPWPGPADSAIEKLHYIKKDLSTAYDQIADRPAAALASHPETGELVHPREALQTILSDPNYQPGGDDLRNVQKIFGDQLTKLERLEQAGEPIKAGTLMKMREGFRDAAQLARLNSNHSASLMYQDAADAMTGGLRGTQLPRDLALLDKTDAAYAKFMKVAGAAKRAGGSAEEGEFGPKQLGAELQRAYGLRFATDPNAGGELRDLSRAGKYAFTPRDAATGHGEKLKSLFGLSLGSQVSRANTDPVAQKLFMLGAQRAAEAGHVAPPPAAGEIEQALARALGRTPAAAASVSPGIAAFQDLLNGRRQ